MQEKNELSDIILDNKNNSNSTKTKKILFLAIILILIFIFAVIGMKLFNKPEVKKNHFNIVLPPEPSSKIEPKKEDLFKQVPIVKENNTASNDNFNAMVEKLKNKEQQKEKSAKAIAQTAKASSNKAVKTEKKDTKKALNKIKKEFKPIKKSIKTGNTYVQVGVTFKTKPDKKYLQKISKAGYTYKLYNIKISGKNATKILIGPYKDRKSAKADLLKIKKEINKAAFIYVVK
jgi:DedD protein